MDLQEIIDGLKNYQEWRRGSEVAQLSPVEVGKLIDEALEQLERIRRLKANVGFIKALVNNGSLNLFLKNDRGGCY